MNPSRHWFILVSRMTLLFLFTLVVTACPTAEPEGPILQNSGIQTPSQEDGSDMAIIGSAPAPRENVDDYKVLLEADKRIRVESSGYLRVWIGAQEYMPKKVKDIVRDTTTVYAESDSYAIVTPIAPDFEVNPAVSPRIPLQATGSSFAFTLTPLKKGKSFVSATVVIYDREGNEIPQSTQRLSVRVSSNFWGRQEKHADDMEEVFWKQFLNFFTALVVLVLGALLFVIRRYIKKKTGYDEKENKENL